MDSYFWHHPVRTTVGEGSVLNLNLAFRYWSKLDTFTQAHMDAQHGVVLSPAGFSWVNSWGSMGHAAGAAAIISAYGRDVADVDVPRAAAMKKHAQRQVRKLAISPHYMHAWNALVSHVAKAPRALLRAVEEVILWA